MRSKKPNHISLRRLCSPPGNISSSAAERSLHSPLCPSCLAPHAASLLELTPGKHRHGHVLHEPFSSSRNQHKAASYFDIFLYRARSSLCHPLPPGQAAPACVELTAVVSQKSALTPQDMWALGCSQQPALAALPSRYEGKRHDRATPRPCRFCMCRLPPHQHLSVNQLTGRGD